MNKRPESIQEARRQLENKFTSSHRLKLIFGDCRIDCLTNSEKLKQDLAHYFKPFISNVSNNKPHITIHSFEGDIPNWDLDLTVKQPDPGKTKIKEEFVDLPDGRLVRKRLTGMLFLFGKGNNIAIGPCIQNSNQVINFINNRFMEWKLNQDYFLAHAAGVVWQGAGISMAGFSGMGKSTLALHLMSRGAKFVSNDRLLFKKEDSAINMIGVAKLPRINPGTALNNPDLQGVMPKEDCEKFRELTGAELWNLEHKYDVYIDECFGPDKFVLAAPMNLIVMLNWDHSNKNLKTNFVDFADRRDLLGAFMKSPGLFYEPEEIVVQDNLSDESYVSELSGFPILEISGSVDFDEAADAISNIINSKDGNKNINQNSISALNVN